MARTFEPLARRLIKAVHDLAGDPSTEWVPLAAAFSGVGLLMGAAALVTVNVRKLRRS